MKTEAVPLTGNCTLCAVYSACQVHCCDEHRTPTAFHVGCMHASAGEIGTVFSQSRGAGLTPHLQTCIFVPQLHMYRVIL